MPLILTQISGWNTIRPEKLMGVAYLDYVMLNTNRMSDIKSHDDGSTFKYLQAPDDHRCSYDTIICDKTVNQLRTAHDDNPDSKFGTFSIFPTLDITRVTVDTPVNTDIEWDDICYVYQTPRDRTLGVSHMVYYDKSFKRKTVIIDMDVLDVLTEQNAAPV